jgi:alpha-beta hydrolase superfamily lysophospholipase
LFYAVEDYLIEFYEHEPNRSGRNKIFNDLAVGLANFGISSYRYDKRTFTYPKMDSSITIDKEVTNDIMELIKFIKRNEKEDTKIFLIGHSLGGMLTPRIWDNCQNDLDGLIMMASNARPFEELLLYQFNYLASIDGIVDSAENIAIKQLNQQIENLNDGKLENLPFGQPYTYWKSLKEYDQIMAAKKVNVPMLIIQGARDYQVPIDDFEIWQHELENKKQVTFKLFKKLDHLFLAGKGHSTPQDYMNESKNIPYYVIKTMAKWMKKH